MHDEVIITDKVSNVLIDIYKAHKEGHNIWYARQYLDDNNVSQEIFKCNITNIDDFLNQIRNYNYFDKLEENDIRTLYAVREAINRGQQIHKVYYFNYGSSLIQIGIE